MRTKCPFCLRKFDPPAGESRFVLHLYSTHGWGSIKARQFIGAQEQCRAPEWMQRPAIEARRTA